MSPARPISIINGVLFRNLELELLWLFPGEALVGEVTVLGSLEVDWLGQVELLDDNSWAEIEVLADNLLELIRGVVRGSVGVDEDGEWLRDTDGVGKLDESTSAELGVNQRLGDPASDVGSGSVDLGEILSGESTTSVGTPSTVGVNDDLAAGQTSITLWATDDEKSGWLDVVDGLVIQVLGWDNLLDDLLEDLLAELLSGDCLGVLGRDDNGVDTEWDNGTTIVLVLNGDLGLGIWSQPWDGTVTAGCGHLSVELVGKLEGEWEELWGLVGGITEHDTLVTGTELLKSLVVVKTLGNIWGLLLNGNQDVASLVVESLGGVVVSDVLDGITDNLLVVELGLGGNLTENHDHTGLGGSLASNLGERVLSQAGIEDGIGDLISDLIWVSLTDRLGGEQESAGVVVVTTDGSASIDSLSVGGHCAVCVSLLLGSNSKRIAMTEQKAEKMLKGLAMFCKKRGEGRGRRL